MKEHQEEWLRLCEQASTEQDPVKLLALITKINELLLQKEKRLIQHQSPTNPENSK